MRLERVTAAVAGVGALALLGGLYVYGRRLRERRGAEDADVTSELANAVREAAGSRVLDRDAADGVDARLQAFLDDWDENGPHVIRVANGVFGGHRYVGGVRDRAQQLDDFNANLSKAKPVDERDSTNVAPHMHRGALDIWPRDFVPNRSFEEQPVPADYPAMFKAQADFARTRHGLTAGFYWQHPDMPHVELPDWKTLPVTNG